MFVLRRLTSQNVERNTVLGESYLLIDAERNPEDFEKSLGILKNDRNDVYGFISYNEGGKLIPLYKKSVYFIMMGNGQTFSNITHM
jgi:hypothetical protein